MPNSEESPAHFFESVADHLGSAYLRYSFTKGTIQEVDFLVDALGLTAGDRVLDVGCGPGRHAYELAKRGIVVHGVDISERFIEIARADAPAGATFERADARRLELVQGFGDYDAAISLCQGAFGLAALAGEPVAAVDPDGVILAGMGRAVRAGGCLAVSAFSSYFQVRYHENHDSFDADGGVNHEITTIKSETGESMQTDLWTSCFTPRELRLLARQSGLVVDHVWGVTPGTYERSRPTTDTPEFLLLAHRPS